MSTAAFTADSHGLSDTDQLGEQLAFLLNSGMSLNDHQPKGGAAGAWLTQTDILTDSLADFDFAAARTMRRDDDFQDSAQDLCESAYSSHLSSCQDIMSSINSGVAGPPELLYSADLSIAANGVPRDGGLDPMAHSLPASVAQDATASGVSGPGTSYRPGPQQKDPRSQHRGQGYRRLWQQVTKVSKGQKLQDNLGAAFSDMTVEDLLKIVLKLAPQESAVDAIKQGLYYLDSSAMAALLKELAKQGYLKRAVEIFDWLRGLDSSHELSSLCDL